MIADRIRYASLGARSPWRSPTPGGCGEVAGSPPRDPGRGGPPWSRAPGHLRCDTMIDDDRLDKKNFFVVSIENELVTNDPTVPHQP